jgi:hypothetical protein
MAGNPTWVKGQSGNPTGRPRTKPITDEIKRLGQEGAFDRIAKMLVDRALDGDLKAAQEILNRVEGKVTDRITVEAGSVDIISLLTRKSVQNVTTPDPDTDPQEEPSNG